MTVSLPSEGISIRSLAEQVSNLAQQIASYIDTTQAPQPTFSPNSPEPPDSPEYNDLRVALNDSANDLLALANGPRNTLRSQVHSQYDLGALCLALQRKYFQHVPRIEDSGQGITARELAKKAKMDEDRTLRVMRILATHRIFAEIDVGEARFAHTAASALLADDEAFNSLMHMQLEDQGKAVTAMSKSVDESPFDTGMNACPWYSYYNAPCYETMNSDPQKAKRFAAAMDGYAKQDRQADDLLSSYPWSSLPSGSKVVDVGGGSGHISIGLASQFPALNFVVQDGFEPQLTEGRALIAGTPSLEARVSFQKHDFFAPQPVRDADVYFIRQCLHNHNDADCVRILRAMVTALEGNKPGRSLIISDVIMPESGSIARYQERVLRQVDIAMLVIFGAKQRSAKEFEGLLREADERFRVARFRENAAGVGFLEAHLQQT